MSDYLTVGGLAVEVADEGGARREWDELGDAERAFDGTLLTSNHAQKRRWSIRTVPVSVAAADALETVLRAAPPVLVSGRMVGGATVSCVAKLEPWDDQVDAAGETLYVCAFALMEV